VGNSNGVFLIEINLDQYFSNPAAYHQASSSSSRSSSSSGADSKKIKALYEKYRGYFSY